MKLELPDNNASVLFHMGNALQCIARDIDATLPVNGHKTTVVETVGDVSHSVTIEPLVTPPEADFTDNHIADDDTTDADGLPWDQRIHSRGKTRLADNTWRMARKPNDKTDEEWAEYVEDVKAELRELMAIPVATVEAPVVIEAPEVVMPPVVIEAPEVVTPPVVIEAPEVVTPPVVEPVVTPPVVEPVVTPPAVEPVVTPPVVEAVAGPVTFPELMRFITMNNAKLTKDVVDATLKAQGLASIALLAARPDLIPQVHAALSELL